MAGMFGHSQAVRGRFREASGTWRPPTPPKKFGGRWLSSQVRQALEPVLSSVAGIPPPAVAGGSPLPEELRRFMLGAEEQRLPIPLSVYTMPQTTAGNVGGTPLPEELRRFVTGAPRQPEPLKLSRWLTIQRLGRKYGGRFIASQIRFVQFTRQGASILQTNLPRKGRQGPFMKHAEWVRRLRPPTDSTFRIPPAVVAGSAMPEELRRFGRTPDRQRFPIALSIVWTRNPLKGRQGGFMRHADAIREPRFDASLAWSPTVPGGVVAFPMEIRRFLLTADRQPSRESESLIVDVRRADQTFFPFLTGADEAARAIPLSTILSPIRIANESPVELREFIPGSERQRLPIPLSLVWSPKTPADPTAQLPEELRKFLTTVDEVRPRLIESMLFPVQRRDQTFFPFVTGSDEQPRTVPLSSLWKPHENHLPVELVRFVTGANRQPLPIPWSLVWEPQIPESPTAQLPEQLRRFVTGADRVRPRLIESLIVPVRRLDQTFYTFATGSDKAEALVPLSSTWTPAIKGLLPEELLRFVLGSDRARVIVPQVSLSRPMVAGLQPEELRRFLTGADAARLINATTRSSVTAPQIPTPLPMPSELRKFTVGADRIRVRHPYPDMARPWFQEMSVLVGGVLLKIVYVTLHATPESSRILRVTLASEHTLEATPEIDLEGEA